MPRVRDQQRSKVYKWESIHADTLEMGAPTMTLEECKTLAHKAITWWFRLKSGKNTRPMLLPRVKKGREDTSAWADVDTISLPEWAWTKGSVLHETAHCIVANQGLWSKDGGHGPYFMRVYIELLGQYLKINRSETTPSAKKSKLKVHTMSKIDRPKP